MIDLITWQEAMSWTFWRGILVGISVGYLLAGIVIAATEANLRKDDPS
jgi:hypothetical protein